MRTQTVEFVQYRERVQMVLMPDAFEPQDFRWKWVKRVVAWLFRKLGKNAREPSVTYERIVIHPDDLIERLYAQMNALLDLDREPRRVLIGAETLAELMSCPRLQDIRGIACEYSCNRTICSLTVTVIPWMKGLLVMPDGRAA